MTAQLPAKNAHALGDLHSLVGALAGIEAGLATLAVTPGQEVVGTAPPPDLAVKLAILARACAEPGRGLTPSLAPFAARGHDYPAIDRLLFPFATDARSVLEELADLDLLRRELHNRVHVCPRCAACQINFRETCPGCGGIDLAIERMLHHFACAYVGLEREFADGAELQCPKCRERLFQLGQDFERPHETYECRTCAALTETPIVGGQCLHCAHVFPAHGARLLDIHTYAPTALATRALELQRLTALQVADLLFDPDARLARLDYLVLEARREFTRLRRHPGALSAVRMRFQVGGEPFAFFRCASAREVHDFGRLLATKLRDLDLAAPTDPATLSLLLPETDAAGAAHVADRIGELCGGLALRSPEGHAVTVAFRQHTWAEAPADIEDSLQIVRGLD